MAVVLTFIPGIPLVGHLLSLLGDFPGEKPFDSLLRGQLASRLLLFTHFGGCSNVQSCESGQTN